MTLPAADEVFLALAAIDPNDRNAFLDARCGDDAALRRTVEALVLALDVPDEFLDPARIPVLDMAAIDGPLQAGTRLGQFLVLRALGSGGMGVVYAAQQERPRRTVAIKVLHRGVSRPDVLRRFEYEAELLGRLQHPGIAQVYAFCPGDRAFPAHLVMELVAGPPLTDYVRVERLTIRQRVGLVVKLTEAVQHAHERGVIHRDLKPANVLVASGGQPKVLDFGIARAVGADVQRISVQTAQGQLMGTLPYMSPEQLQKGASEVDARSDVYALGVLLYRLLTERLPFNVSSMPWAQAIHCVLESEPVSAAVVNPDVARPLDQIVARAMSRDSRRRYQTASDFGSDLERFLAGDEPAGVPAAPRAGRGARQHERDAPSVMATAANDTICVATKTGRLIAWSASTGDEQWSVAAGEARALAASASGRFVAAGFDSGAIALFETESGALVASLDAHDGPVIAMAFGWADRYLASADDHAVRLWDAATNHCVATLLENESGGVALTALADGRIAMVRADGSVEMIALPSGVP